MDSKETDAWLQLTDKQLLLLSSPQIETLLRTIRDSTDRQKIQQAKEQLIDILSVIYD